MKEKFKILIVDDDDGFRSYITQIISELDSKIDQAADGSTAINLINQNSYDLILLDMGLPDISGMKILEFSKTNIPSTQVIVLTGSKDIKLAVSAMKQGAYDYLFKPIIADELILSINRALETKTLRRRIKLFERTKETDEIIGNSEAWLAIFEKAKRYAESDAVVYIEGETGCGKEVIAKYIHLSSHRNKMPFISVDCGVIPETLIESELFGHAKGGYTGADKTKEGLVELAQHGTLFLDEISNIDLKFQQKLLKFVETKTFRRVGETNLRSVDARIIAASNKNLAKEVAGGRFLTDLRYRLNVLKLEVPPLRMRKSDIIPLAEYFLKRFSYGRPIKNITPEAIAALENYSWPGNIRELQSTIERAIIVSDDDLITLEDLSLETPLVISPSISAELFNELTSLYEAEKKYIAFVLNQVNWNISRAAKILQIGRNTLYFKLKEYNINPPEN